MRIEQLEYLDAIVRYGSLRRAGEHLKISQPALSESIANLERELGVRLLDRHRTGARISPAGRALLPNMAEVLDAIGRFRSAASAQHRPWREVRIAAVHSATVPIVAPALDSVRARYPDLHVEVIGAPQDEVRTAVLEDAVEFGLVNLLDDDSRTGGLVSTELLRGRAVVCCRTDSRLATLPAVRLSQLASEPLIRLRAGHVMNRLVDRLLDAPRAGSGHVADGAEMAKMLVADGLGVTVLPDYNVVGDPLERAGVITARRLEADGTGVALVLQSRRGGRRSSASRDLEDALRERARAVAALLVGPLATPAS